MQSRERRLNSKTCSSNTMLDENVWSFGRALKTETTITASLVIAGVTRFAHSLCVLHALHRLNKPVRELGRRRAKVNIEFFTIVDCKPLRSCCVKLLLLLFLLPSKQYFNLLSEFSLILLCPVAETYRVQFFFVCHSFTSFGFLCPSDQKFFCFVLHDLGFLCFSLTTFFVFLWHSHVAFNFFFHRTSFQKLFWHSFYFITFPFYPVSVLILASQLVFSHCSVFSFTSHNLFLATHHSFQGSP